MQVRKYESSLKILNSDTPLAAREMLYELLEHPIVHKAVSYTHLRAHETVLDLVCRLLLEKKK